MISLKVFQLNAIQKLMSNAIKLNEFNAKHIISKSLNVNRKVYKCLWTSSATTCQSSVANKCVRRGLTQNVMKGNQSIGRLHGEHRFVIFQSIKLNIWRNTIKLMLVFSLVIVSVSAAETANDRDVAHWKEQAQKNANEDLDKWEAIVSSGDHAKIHNQLDKLNGQVLSAANNMNRFVPTLGKAVTTIHFLAGGGCIKTLALKGAIAVIYGKRDNKSYYLLDGAHNWIELRVNALKGKNDELEADLQALDIKIISDRDELDNNAQKFVTNLNKIHDLLQERNPNHKQIKATADEMYEDYQNSGSLLKNNQELIDQSKALVAKYP